MRSEFGNMVLISAILRALSLAVGSRNLGYTHIQHFILTERHSVQEFHSNGQLRWDATLCHVVDKH